MVKRTNIVDPVEEGLLIGDTDDYRVHILIIVTQILIQKKADF